MYFIAFRVYLVRYVAYLCACILSMVIIRFHIISRTNIKTCLYISLVRDSQNNMHISCKYILYIIWRLLRLYCRLVERHAVPFIWFSDRYIITETIIWLTKKKHFKAIRRVNSINRIIYYYYYNNGLAARNWIPFHAS